MENYKVRVNNEAESKEIQELFFELDGKWWAGGCNIQHTGATGLYLENGLILFGYASEAFNTELHKEITLPELRDLVVLKRNDFNDATHACESKHHRRGYLSSDGVEYMWFYSKKEWFKAERSFNEYGLKPIEKTMKEYLDPEDGYSLVNAIHALPHWIEVPEGSEGYYQYRKGEKNNEFFLKKIGDTYYYANEESRYLWEWYAGELKGHEFVLWQREEPTQQHKKLVSIPVEDEAANNTMNDSDFMNLIGQILGNEFTDVQKTLINLALNK